MVKEKYSKVIEGNMMEGKIQGMKKKKTYCALVSYLLFHDFQNNLDSNESRTNNTVEEISVHDD